jgi:hypothetical protein
MYCSIYEKLYNTIEAFRDLQNCKNYLIDIDFLSFVIFNGKIENFIEKLIRNPNNKWCI